MFYRFVVYLFLLLVGTASQAQLPGIELPRIGLLAGELAVIVNQRDPLSVRLGEYYQQARGIPEANIIRVAFTPGKPVLSQAEFADIKSQVDAAAGPNIQGFALSWTLPYRVDCMSISSAFAFGFDSTWCARGCRHTRHSDYYNSVTTRPWSELGIRPAMMLAATNFDQGKAMIDRGVQSDGRMPRGDVYLVETSDNRRSVRKSFYPEIQQAFGGMLNVYWEKTDAIRDKSDIMFYFTGLSRVKGIASNSYLPGAIADHLTSYGGRLTDSKQMSALRWLEAGVTGSYGTVVEPCAFTQKFPNPGVVIRHYLQGSTLLEAYWKSVSEPGQGVFIGEPLARPYYGYQLKRLGDRWLVSSPVLHQGKYRVYQATRRDGPYKILYSQLPVVPMQLGIILPEAPGQFYRIERL